MSDSNQAIEWYLARDGQQHGPINEAELHKVIELGYLRPTDLVWRQGMADWAQAATILPPPEVAQAPAPVAAAPAVVQDTRAARADAPEAGAPEQAPAPSHPRGGSHAAPAPSWPRHAEPAARAPQPQGPQHGPIGHQHVVRNGGAPAPQGMPRNQAGSGGPVQQPAGPQPQHSQSHAGPQAYPHPAPHPQTGHQPQPQLQQQPQWEPHPQRAQAPAGNPYPGGQHGAAPIGHHPQPNLHMGAAPRPHPQPSRPAPQPSPDAFAEPEEPEQRGFPWRLAAVLVVVAGLGGGAFALYRSGQLSALPFLGAPDRTGAVPVVTAPASSARQPEPAAAPAASGGIDQGLQRSPLWQLLKRDFPDWYRERLDEAGRLAGKSADDRDVAAAMTRAVVDLRRKHQAEALAAGPQRLKAIATSFVDNLSRLSRQSTAACYGFISQGEMSAAVAELRAPEQKAAIDAQLASIFEAVAEGRKSPQRHEPPRREDYDVLTGELGKRGWTAADLQLFSDARALARAAPEKVCQMVQDWFAAQLAVKDEATQIRLLGEALKPVVAG